MKKNILKKINPPSFDSFLRNLSRFLLFESRIFQKTFDKGDSLFKNWFDFKTGGLSLSLGITLYYGTSRDTYVFFDNAKWGPELQFTQIDLLTKLDQRFK
jgi:hypothetical protein